MVKVVMASASAGHQPPQSTLSVARLRRQVLAVPWCGRLQTSSHTSFSYIGHQCLFLIRPQTQGLGRLYSV